MYASASQRYVIVFSLSLSSLFRFCCVYRCHGWCWFVDVSLFLVLPFFFVEFDIFLPLSLPDFPRVVRAVCSFVCKCVAFFHHFNFTDEAGVRYRAHIVTCIWWSMIENVLNRFSFVHEWLFLSLSLPQNGIMANTLHAKQKENRRHQNTSILSHTMMEKRSIFLTIDLLREYFLSAARSLPYIPFYFCALCLINVY